MEKLALEILRSPWLLHTDSVQQYSAIAADYLAGKKVSTGFFSSITLPDVPDNVALVTLAGVVTKADVCSSPGSLSLAAQVQAAMRNPEVSAIVVLSESCPGGQVDGTKILADAIIKAASVKPVYGAVSGMACSAAVWALSGCTKIFATSATDQIGCIGVMATMRKSAEGAASYEVVYSSLSPDKNLESRDTEVMKQQYLDPVASLFHTAVKEGRGDRLKLEKENVLSGKTYIANAAQSAGLIDGIKPFSNIVSAALADAKKQKQMSLNSPGAVRFQKVAAVAKTSGFDVTEGGFALNETQLELVNDALATAETDRTAFATAQADVLRLTGELNTAQATAVTAANDLATANARILELEKLDGPTTQATNKGADVQPDEKPVQTVNEKYKTTFDSIAHGY